MLENRRTKNGDACCLHPTPRHLNFFKVERKAAKTIARKARDAFSVRPAERLEVEYTVGIMKMKRIIAMGLLSGLLAAFGCSRQKDTPPQSQPEDAPSAGITVEQEITVGEPVVVDGPSPLTAFAVVFEDDGETGYFYGLDTSRKENPILDALHIYNVSNVTDRHIPSKVQIIWSADGLKSALLINRCPHAIFDFQSKRGYCRTGFPPPVRVMVGRRPRLGRQGTGSVRMRNANNEVHPIVNPRVARLAKG